MDGKVGTCTCVSASRPNTSYTAGLLIPVPVPKRRGGCISHFLVLSVARFGHHFLQVHLDLLIERAWLVPTFKIATAKTATRNFVASVCDDVGLPNVLVSDHDTLYTSALWTCSHAVLSACLRLVARLRLNALVLHLFCFGH